MAKKQYVYPGWVRSTMHDYTGTLGATVYFLRFLYALGLGTVMFTNNEIDEYVRKMEGKSHVDTRL